MCLASGLDYLHNDFANTKWSNNRDIKSSNSRLHMKPKTGENAQTTLSWQSQYHRGSQKKSLVLLREMDQRERENDAFLKWRRKMIKNSALRNSYVRYHYHLFLKEVVIQHIISRRQIDETTIDPRTVKKYKRTETNGRYRVDKTYRHPKSKKWLRSLCKVREFILDSSHTGKTSDNGEGGSQVSMQVYIAA
ncbi:hypothetical protein Hanom_Chr03g00200441 [Helianthus anomalus]